MGVRILTGSALDVLKTLPSELVQASISSPPYYQLRRYLAADDPLAVHELGGEPTPDEYIAHLVAVFVEVRRVLRRDGLLFVNIGTSYAGSGKGPTGHNGIGDQGRRQGFTDLRQSRSVPAKSDLCIPERFVLAMQRDGWVVRAKLPWLKANCMPESVRDRPVSAIEWVFMFARQGHYYWDPESVRRANTAGTLARHGKGPEAPMCVARQHDPRAVPDGRVHEGNLNVNGLYTSGRSFRNSDVFWAHVEAVKAGNGLLLDEDGDPLALLVNPKPSRLEHFAAYPDTLVEPLLRASTSERGACPACGSPWTRVVERAEADFGMGNADAGHQKAARTKTGGPFGRKRTPTGHTLVKTVGETTGWAPSCSCDAGEPRSCVVLDPFLGSGTTLMVASRLGRSGVGIELNETYARLAEDRIRRDVGPMFPDEVQHVATSQPSLFEVAG